LTQPLFIEGHVLCQERERSPILCVRGIDFTSIFYDYLVGFLIFILLGYNSLVSVWISVHIDF